MRSSFQGSPALLLASSLLLGLASPQNIASLPACGQTCWNSSLGEATKLGCDASASLACLCAKPDFTYAIRDCAAQACAGDTAAAVSVTSFASSVCATATIPAPAAATSSTSTTPPPAPATTTSTPPPPPTTSSTTAATQQSTGTVSSSSTFSTSASSGSSSKPTGASSNSTSSGQSSAETDTASSGSSSDSNPPGLSIAAKAGIGVAAAVGLAGILALTLCLLARKKHANKAASRARSMQISDPLPGSGRNYGNGVVVPPNKMMAPASPGSMSELDQRSRRYEDMIPRQTPRHMV